MRFGIQASQGVKLSNIARSLQEEIPLLKTEDRLSRNLQAEELETHLRQGLLRLGRRRVGTNTVLCLDLSDVRKEYARKMEFLDQVWDGSAGEVHPGYWLCSVLGAESTAANSRPSTSNFSPCAPRILSVRMTNCSPPSINCARKPGAAASGPWTVAETGESSWSRCWSGENALSCAPPDSARSSTGSVIV